MRQGPSRARRRRYRAAHRQLARRKGGFDIGDKPRLPTKKVCHRADIDDYPVWCVARAPRPPALRPHSKLFQKGEIARWIGRDRFKSRAHSARVGQGRANVRAAFARGVVQRFDAGTMRGLCDQGDGFSVRAIAAFKPLREPPAIDRQSRAPNGKYPALALAWERHSTARSAAFARGLVQEAGARVRPAQGVGL